MSRNRLFIFITCLNLLTHSLYPHAHSPLCVLQPQRRSNWIWDTYMSKLRSTWRERERERYIGRKHRYKDTNDKGKNWDMRRSMHRIIPRGKFSVLMSNEYLKGLQKNMKEKINFDYITEQQWATYYTDLLVEGHTQFRSHRLDFFLNRQFYKHVHPSSNPTWHLESNK